MLIADEFATHAQGLTATGSNANSCLALVNEVRESIELVHTSEYANFLQAYFKPFEHLLRTVPPSFQDSPEHKLRNLILEIFNRLPNGEVLRPYALQLMSLVLSVLNEDNEDNGLLCLRICFDLHRNYRPALEEQIGPFLAFVQKIYDGVGKTYSHFFESQPDASVAPSEFTHSTASFKVLAETPLQVMFLFNLYPRALPNYASALVPLMAAAVSLPGPDPAALRDKQRPPFVDLKNAQIKTMSFLTYLLRSPYSALVRPHQDSISAALIRTLQTCPDIVSMRKELLVATRHALTTPLRAGFQSQLETMLDEATLVGRGRLCQAELRPLAFSMLAELIHHVRQQLNLPQLSRIVYLFSRNIHDDQLAVSVQCTSVRLLLNLVEVIYSRRADMSTIEQHRALLAKALDTFVSKLSALRRALPRLLAPQDADKRPGKDPLEAAEKKPEGKSQVAATPAAAEPTQEGKEGADKAADASEAADADKATAGRAEADQPAAPAPKKERVILYVMEKSEHDKEMQEARNMLQVLVMGLKTLLYSMANYGNTNPLRANVPHIPSLGLREEEVRLAARAITCGIPCLRVFGTPAIRPSDREVNIYDSFADIFSVIQDPRDVVEMFALQMPFLFRSVLDDHKLLRVFVTLLGSACNRHFANVLLRFLIDEQMPALNRPDSKEGQLTLKLFILYLEALKKFPTVLESVLMPLFPGIISSLIQHTTEAEDKTGFLDLMLALFRTLTTGNFEALYIIFGGAGNSPALLPGMLDLLRGLLDGPNAEKHRDKVVEACLIAPARLSEQLAGLPRLMRPLVLAMEGRDELVALALRTLEYWIDSLNPEFLEPAMASVAPRLLTALASHMRMPPYPFGAKALKLLGKLGGRNRRGSRGPQELDYRDNTEHGLRLVLTFHPNTSFLVPLDRILAICKAIVQKSAQGAEGLQHKRHAVKLMHICLTSVLNLRSPLDSALPGRSVDKLTAMLFGPQGPPQVDTAITSDLGVKTRMQLNAEQQVFKALLATVIATAGEPEVADIAEPIVTGVSRHFAMLFAAGVGSKRDREARSRGTSLKELDPSIYLDALVEVLGEERITRSGAALKSMSTFVETLLKLTGQQRRLHTARLAAAVDADAALVLAGGSPPPHVASDDGKEEAGEKKEEGSEPGGTSPSRQTSVTPKGGYPPVLDELLGKLVHACYGETWPMKFGGASAMVILGRRMPVGQLLAKLALCTKALLAVLRGLPEHAVAERKQINDSLDFLIRRCLMRNPLPPKVAKETEAQAAAAAAAAEQEMPAAEKPAESSPDPSSAAVVKAETGAAATASNQQAEVKQEETVGAEDMMIDAPAQSPSEATPPPQAQPRPPRRIQSAAEERAINGLVQVATMEIFNARSSSELRAAADGVLKTVGEATGKSTAWLMNGILEKLQPPLERRRLLPLKHVPQQTGYAAGLTYCLQQKPPLLALTSEAVNLVRDAYLICEQDPQLLVQTLTTSARQTALEALPAMRMVCLSLVCAAMSWHDFRSVVSPTPASPEGQAPSSPVASSYRDNGELNTLRNQIIQMLFKQLTSTDKKAVKLAQEGLGVVIAHQKMPKHLLQSSLRPILVNLAYYNKLKLPLLLGLARLLQLLASWFNVTLGEKLIDHLKKWLEPDKLLSVPRSWEPGQDADIAAAILNLFHLLPTQAAKFLETSQTGQPQERPGLVVLTIELEKALGQMANNMQPTKMWSPYRDPLAKYLNKYSGEAVPYFLDITRMATASYFNHFLDVIRSKTGRPLLEQLAASPGRIVELLTAPPIDNEKVQALQTDAQYNVLHLIAATVKLLPDWLPEEIFEILMRRWQSPERRARLENEENLPRAQLLESKRLAKAILNYVSRNHGLVVPLFELLDIFTKRTRVNFGFLKEYLATVLPATYTIPERQQVLAHFMAAFIEVKEQRYSQEHLVQAIKLLVLPMLEASYNKGEAVVDDAMLEDMVKHMFDPPEELTNVYGDGMNMELLQLATLLIRRAPQQLVLHRKELIKFGWNHLKRDDSAAKYYAFLNVCHFLEAYQAPEKIVLQVFVALLRTCQPDSRRALVRQALDVLTPALVRRLSSGDSKYPMWVRYAKKVLVEEGHSLAHMIHIWQLLVRHADLFFTSRAQFVPQMVNSLMKLGLPQGASLENRRLAIDLAALVVHWEKQRIDAPSDAAEGAKESRKRTREEADLIKDEDEVQLSKQVRLEGTPDAIEASDPSGPLGSASNADSDAMLLSDAPTSRPLSAVPSLASRGTASSDEEYKPGAPMQEMVLSFLTRMAFLLGDAVKEPEYLLMHKHTLAVLGDALSLWPNALVKLHYIEKLLTANLAANMDPPPALVTGLQVMSKVLAVQPQAFVQGSAQQFNLLIEPCFTCKQPSVIGLLSQTLKTIFKLFPLDQAENPAQVVMTKVNTTMMEQLQAAGTAPHALTPGVPLVGVCAALSILKELNEMVPEYVHKFMPAMVRVLSRISRDNSANSGILLAAKAPIPMRAARDAEAKTDPEYGTITWAVCAVIPLTAPHVHKLAPEQKRGYLQTLILLISNPSAAVVDPAVVMAVLQTVRSWLLDANVAQITLADKDALVFLRHLAELQHSGKVVGPLRERFEHELLDLIHTICTTNVAHGQTFQRDVFERVERQYLLGLRVSDPDMRRRFFELYNSNLPATLFDRLKFIICAQDWEAASGGFWLKQALELLMAILVGKDPLRLAPNSAQIPVLIAETKQNVFNVRDQQEAQAAALAASSATSSASVAGQYGQPGPTPFQRPPPQQQVGGPQQAHPGQQQGIPQSHPGQPGYVPAQPRYAPGQPQYAPGQYGYGPAQPGSGPGQPGQPGYGPGQPGYGPSHAEASPLQSMMQQLGAHGPPGRQQGMRPQQQVRPQYMQGYAPSQGAQPPYQTAMPGPQQPGGGLPSHANAMPGAQQQQQQQQLQQQPRPAYPPQSAAMPSTQQQPGQPQPGTVQGQLERPPPVQGQLQPGAHPQPGPQPGTLPGPGIVPGPPQQQPGPQPGAQYPQGGLPAPHPAYQSQQAQPGMLPASQPGPRPPQQAGPTAPMPVQYSQPQATGAVPPVSGVPQPASGAPPPASGAPPPTPMPPQQPGQHGQLQSAPSASQPQVAALQRQHSLQRAPSSQALHLPLQRAPSSQQFLTRPASQVLPQGVPRADGLLPMATDSPGAQPGIGRGSSEKPKDDGLGEREMYKDLDLLPEIDVMLHEHCEFLVNAGHYRVEQLVSALLEVSHHNSQLSYHLWVLVFPIVWATLSDDKNKQIHLAKPIIALLSKEYHDRQAHMRPNVVQALLEGISLSQPQPKIPSELIKFLGKTYNAWHIAIPLLESHVMLFPQETRCFDALAELYSMLNEDDVLFGLWKRRCFAEETRSALAHVQHGDVEAAQDVLLEAMHKQATGAYLTDSPIKLSKGEQALWQNQYVKACAELNQWETVGKYAQATENYSLLTDCLIKSQEWLRLKDEVMPKAMQPEDAPETHMARAYLCLQEGNLVEADGRVNLSINAALDRWWALPEVGNWSHMPLLARFQQIVELQESARLILDLGAAQRPDHHYRDLKDIMETWRLRTPNEWERLSTWGDVLIWRNQIYNIVINAFKQLSEVAPHLHQLGFRDKAWSVNRLGCVARKHGNVEAAKIIINTLYGFNAMEVQEAFIKIREQAKAFLQQPEQLMNGLNLLNAQNLEYFQPQHQAELFRMRGLFLQELGNATEANASFSTALTLCTQLSDGWLSWGAFCDAQFLGNKQTIWLESAVTSYLQGVRQGSTAARGMLPRVLNMLAFDNESGVVGKALERGVRQVAGWVWLAWLPQLLTSLQRPEAPYAKRILVDIARIYPQALYYGLRTYLLMMREIAHKALSERRQAAAAAAQPAAAAAPPAAVVPAADPAAAAPPQPASAGATDAPETTGAGAAAGAGSQPNGSASQAGEAAAKTAGAPPVAPSGPEGAAATPAAPSSAGPAKAQDKPPELVAFEAGREVMEILRSSHSHVCSILEVMCTDIGQRFVPKPEERLLGVVHALLHRAYKLPFSNAAEVPMSLKKELAGVCRVCFSDDNATKHGRVVAQYRDHFLRDLNPDPNPNFPTSLGDLAARLKAWRNTLQATVEETMDPVLRLEDESRTLLETSLVDVEMPGQYARGEEVSQEGLVYIERLGSDVAIIRRHGLSFRRLEFHGSNGKTRYFIVQSGQQWSSGEERLMQLLRMMNKLLDKHPESRCRQLAWHTPTVVPVWPQVRLIEEDPSYATYGEAYEINCARYGREPDLPIVKFKQLCCTETGQLIADPQGVRRLQAYHEIEKVHVTENIFSQFMYKTLPTCNHLWTFKKQFCIQLSLSALLSHMLLVGGRSPNKILFAKSSGKLWQAEFYPTYDSHGLLERNEPVPFRLTRNLHTFFTPFGVEGIFVSALAVAAQAVLGKHSNLKDVLGLFLRDDILGWSARRSGRSASVGNALPNEQLADLVRANVDRALERLESVAPPRAVDGNTAIDPQRGARELVMAALDPRNLSKQDPTWMSWL